MISQSSLVARTSVYYEKDDLSVTDKGNGPTEKGFLLKMAKVDRTVDNKLAKRTRF